MGKKVCFEDEHTDVEGPTHRADTESQQIIELEPAHDVPADTESATTPNVVLKDKIIKDRAESTKTDKGRVNKRQVRKESTTTTGENNQAPPKSQTEGGTSSKTLDIDGSTNVDRQTELIQ